MPGIDLGPDSRPLTPEEYSSLVQFVERVERRHVEQKKAEAAAEEASVHKAPLARQPHFTMGILTQFLYIAAQVGVNAFAVNYILENAITRDASGATVTDPLFAWYAAATNAASPEATAAYVITIAMILYATGRFSGAAITHTQHSLHSNPAWK